MNYLSVCSGIEAATQAFHPLGWQPVAFSEIEPFPCAVLKHHYPDVPNWGDMTKFQEWPDATVDVLCGGTPCQSFSVAGLRQGLADPRGNLMLTFGAIAARYRPKWVVWENVPGVLSSDGGRDFGSFLSLLGQLGYGYAYRVLDAQYVRTRRFPHAVPQRRRRVFVVGYLGDWRRAAAVLFDRESLSGHPAPRREAGQGIARGIEFGPSGGGFADVNPTLDARAKDGPIRNQIAGAVLCAETAPCLDASFHDKQGLDNQHINGGGACSYVPPIVSQAMSSKWSKGSSGPAGDEIANLVAQTGGGFDVAHSLRAGGFDASEDGTGRGTPLVPISFGAQNAAAQGDEVTVGFVPSLDKSKTPAVAFDLRGREGGAMPEGPHDTANIRAADGGSSRSYVAHPWAVRRSTPEECESLMGFPRGFTRIPYRGKPADKCPDGPRYKALGNSWAVNCADWIAERIAEVDAMESAA